MSREKQIECASCLHYNACLINSEYVPSPCRAYENNAGYRKQSEVIANNATTTGEWIKQEKIRGKTSPEAVCSNCGREVVYQVIDNKWAFENYCPRCGAKMKGGAE